mgnify:CR=1 FL=1
MLPILIEDIEVARIYFFTPRLFWYRVGVMDHTYHYLVNITFYYISDVTL